MREYFEEVMRPRYFRTNKGSVMLDQNSPWVRMPWRMLRAKTVIQAVRNAYPVGGFEVMSEDEVEEATAEADARAHYLVLSDEKGADAGQGDASWICDDCRQGSSS